MSIVSARASRPSYWTAARVGAVWRNFDLQLVTYAALLLAFGLAMAYSNSATNGEGIFDGGPIDAPAPTKKTKSPSACASTTGCGISTSPVIHTESPLKMLARSTLSARRLGRGEVGRSPQRRAQS